MKYFFILLSLSIAACGSDNSNQLSVNDSALLGVWVSADHQDIFTFKSDRTFTHNKCNGNFRISKAGVIAFEKVDCGGKLSASVVGYSLKDKTFCIGGNNWNFCYTEQESNIYE